MKGRIGIDLGGTKLSGVVLGDDGAELTRMRIPTPRQDYSGTLAAIAGLVAELEHRGGLPAGGPSVGVGTPGSWQPRLERMKNCNSTWLNGQPLRHDLNRLLGDRVRMANDADCLALSEAADGAGAGAGSLFAAILGTGVGGGLVLAGRLVTGVNGLAGEWGHVPLPYFRQRVFGDPDPADPLDPADPVDPAEAARFQLECRLEDRACYCGRMNCAETFLSGPGLAATAVALWSTPRSVEELAAARDAGAEACWDLYAHMLARSLAQVVNLVDPEVVVLGGGLSNVTRLYPLLETLVPRYAFTTVRGVAGAGSDDVRVRVRPARWGDDSGVRGAARLWDAA